MRHSLRAAHIHGRPALRRGGAQSLVWSFFRAQAQALLAKQAGATVWMLWQFSAIFNLEEHACIVGMFYSTDYVACCAERTNPNLFMSHAHS